MTVKEEVITKKEDPSDAKLEADDGNNHEGVEGIQYDDDEAARGNNQKHKRGRNMFSQGYEYEGENSTIGVVLALKSERFNMKVVFSSFIEKLKNYILTNFDDSRDMMPILENLKDPTDEIKSNQPIDLTKDEETSDVKKWIKQEEIKKHINRLTTLDNNKETLYGLIWGQCSHGMHEVIKADEDYELKNALFDCIWLLEKVKLILAGVDSRANKYCTLIQALTYFCLTKQGANESNDSYRKRIDAATLTLSLAGGEHMLYSPILIEAKIPNAPSETELAVEENKLKAVLMILNSDSNRYTTLVESLFEGVYKGRDEFPTTVTAAYELLQHISIDTGYYKPRRRRIRFNNN